MVFSLTGPSSGRTPWKFPLLVQGHSLRRVMKSETTFRVPAGLLIQGDCLYKFIHLNRVAGYLLRTGASTGRLSQTGCQHAPEVESTKGACLAHIRLDYYGGQSH